MSDYIDGFIIPIPKDKIDEYMMLASKAAVIWREHGALEYREFVGDDMNVDEQIPFPRFAGATLEETVIFAYARYRSKEVRDEANRQIMVDPRIKDLCEKSSQLFDFKRMAFGGFKSLI